MMFLAIGVLILMLTIVPVPSTSLTSRTSRTFRTFLTTRPQAYPQVGPPLSNRRNRGRTIMCLKASDLKIRVVAAVVGSMLGISSWTTPSFAESGASKDMASISSVNKANRPVISKQTSESVLSDRIDKTEDDIIEINGNIKKIESDVIEIKGNIKKIDSNIIKINEKIEDSRRDETAVFCVASILFVIRSEVKDDQMKKVMDNNKAEADAKMAEIDAKIDKNKAEADAKMDKNKAEADSKMDRNFVITSLISAGSLLVSLLMTLATKK